MGTRNRTPLAMAALLALHLAGTAHAGRSCEVARPTVASIQRGLELAQRTHAALEAAHARDGVQVVLLARAGQDLTKYGLRYSHLGIAYRTTSGQGRPAWRVLHKLNQCGSDQAAVYRQGLGEFFLDDLWRYEAAWSVPARPVQDRLRALLQDERRALALHQRRYSIVSYAWGGRYQQSNQWAIETLASAMDPAAASRDQAQAWLRLQGYQPATLRINAIERMGGQLGAANVAFDDHPPAKRFAGRIETVTVDSVFAWMERAGLGSAPVTLR